MELRLLRILFPGNFRVYLTFKLAYSKELLIGQRSIGFKGVLLKGNMPVLGVVHKDRSPLSVISIRFFIEKVLTGSPKID